MNISRSGWGYPSGRRITPLTTEKIAVLAPMPERERQDGDQGEPRRPQQVPDGVTEILDQRGHGAELYGPGRRRVHLFRRLTCARDVTIV